VKLVLAEEGTPDARTLWDQVRVVTSVVLIYAEAHAAIAAAERVGRLAAHDLRPVRRELDGYLNEMTLVEVDLPLARHAADLAERHGLRGYDAVHLATALAIADPDLVVATWDDELARAARDEGRLVAPCSSP